MRRVSASSCVNFRPSTGLPDDDHASKMFSNSPVTTNSYSCNRGFAFSINALDKNAARSVLFDDKLRNDFQFDESVMASKVITLLIGQVLPACFCLVPDFMELSLYWSNTTSIHE